MKNYVKDCMIVVISMIVVLLSSNTIPTADQAGWLISSIKVSETLKDMNFSPEYWWEMDDTAYGNLNPMLPKILIGVTYTTGIDLYNLMNDSNIKYWNTPWKFGYNKIDRNKWNKENAIPNGVHKLFGNFIPALATGICILLITKMFKGYIGIVVASLMLLHPICASYGGQIMTDSMYWMFLLLSTFTLIKLNEKSWYSILAVYGILIGLASSVKIIAWVICLAILIITVELNFKMNYKKKYMGYITCIISMFATIYLLNPAWWIDVSNIDIAKLNNEINSISSEDIGNALNEFDEISGENRKYANEKYPQIYNMIRPMEFFTTPFRFKTMMVWQKETFDALNKSNTEYLFSNCWWMIPLILITVNKIVRNRIKNIDFNIFIISFIVHIIFVYGTVIATFDRYYMPTIIYLILISGAGVQMIMGAHNSNYIKK